MSRLNATIRRRKAGGLLEKVLLYFFPGADMKNTWCTIGRTVWTPESGYLPQEILEHEGVHVHQQRHWLGALIWWVRYINSKKFRYSQEIPAYRAQCVTLAKEIKDRNVIARMYDSCAAVMASDQYGKMCTHSQALKDLRA